MNLPSLLFPLLAASLLLSPPSSGAEKKAATPKNTVTSRVLSENDQLGRAVKISFLNKNLKPTTLGNLNSHLEKLTLGTQGFSSVTLEYKGEDPYEIPTYWIFYDANGKETITSEGFSRIRTTPDDEGRLSEIRYLDSNDTLINTKEGFAYALKSYDGTNNVVREAYFDKDNKLALNKKRGYAALNIKYIKNDKEEYEERSFEDPQGNPLAIDNAYKHVQGLSKGEDPMSIIQSYNNLDDSPVNGPGGYALHVIRPLSNKKNPKEAYLNDKSELVDGPEGFAQLFQSKDEESGMEKLQYLNAKGEPVNHPHLLWSTQIFKLTEKGKMTDSVYLDKDGKELKKD